MTKEELQTICKHLTVRIKQLEDELSAEPTPHPDDFYLNRLREAFKWIGNADKNDLARRAEGKAIQNPQRIARTSRLFQK